MDTNERTVQLVECLIHVIGRAAIPLDKVTQVVGTTSKHIKAFNLCDGSKCQKEVAHAVRIDAGNLSRAFDRWVKNGVAFWIGKGNDAKLLHLYPIPETQGTNRKTAKRGRK